MTLIHQYLDTKESAVITKIFSEANQVMIKACLAEILLWITNEWLSELTQPVLQTGLL